MADCNTIEDSYFKFVLEESNDFRNRNIYELSVDELKNIDPVGYNYFLKRNVDRIFAAQRRLNPSRDDLRDVLRQTTDMWRLNSQGRQVLNEPKYTTPREIAMRVRQLLAITQKKLQQESRVDNQVTSYVIFSHEYEIPLSNPIQVGGKLSSATRVRHTGIQPYTTPNPFRPIHRSRNKGGPVRRSTRIAL